MIMSRRRPSRDCLHYPDIDDCKKTWCKYGCCQEWKCRSCRKVAFGFGPMLCKCDAPRSFLYPDMRSKPHPSIKENKMRKRKRSARFR
jgi:hypothetical protein